MHDQRVVGSNLYPAAGSYGCRLQYAVCVLAVMLLTGCVRTDVQLMIEYDGTKQLPQPDLVQIYDFVSSSDDTSSDSTATSEAADKIDVGRAVTIALAEALVEEIEKLGLPAERVIDDISGEGNILSIGGEFLHIDEGSRFKRMVIGFGVGSSEVNTIVHSHLQTGDNKKLVQEFLATAKGSDKPGMGPMSGLGAPAGHAASSAAVSTGVGAVSEKRRSNVEVLAQRLAKEIIKHMVPFFTRQGWIEGDKVKK